MAWVSDEPMIYEKLTPMEYLAFVAGLWGVDADLAATRARDLLSWLDLTTHILEVAERMADRIGVIASGRLVAEGTLAELRQQNGKDTSLEDLFIALVERKAEAA